MYCNIQVQFSSVAQLCPTLCDPVDCSTPGLPVHHHSQSLLKLMSVDTIQPSHPLSSLSPPAFNLSQHQGLFQWVSSSHQVAKVLEFQLIHRQICKTQGCAHPKEDTGKARLPNLSSQGIKTRAGDSFHCYVHESRGSSLKIGMVRTHQKGQRALPGPAWVGLHPWPWSRQAPPMSPASVLHTQERREKGLAGWQPHSRGQETLTPKLRTIPPAWGLSCCSVVPFFSRPQSFPASGSFPMSWLKALELQFQHQHHSFQWIFRTDLL